MAEAGVLVDDGTAATREHEAAADPLFDGPGEVRALARTLDWGATPLGPPSTWSPALRIAARAMFDAPLPICLWSGPEFALVYNDAYRRILAAKHPAALGRPGGEVWAEIWEELEPQFARVRAGGPPVYREDAPFEMARLEGGGTEHAWFSYTLSALRDEDGSVAAVLNISPETTARVRAERALDVERMRLRDVFRRAPSFMVVYRGPDHVSEFVNEAYYQLVGHRDILGRPLLEAIPEVRGQGFVELLTRVRDAGEPWVGRETPAQLQRTPGAPLETRYVDMVFQPLLEADGTRSGVVAHGTDVTEQVLARREVERLLAASERARGDAEEAGRLKSEFLATMSHEFRTPLNAIVGYAQLLDMGVLGTMSPAQHAHLERLQSSARHLLQLVDDVLDVAKVDAHRLDVRRDTLPVAGAVASALALVQPQAAAKAIRLEDDCGVDAAAAFDGPYPHRSHPDGSQYVGDEHRVRQILVNLLANAIKFTPYGGRVVVTCGGAASPDPGVQPGGGVGRARGEPGWTFVRVHDTGPGVASALLARLFEPFMQGDMALTRAHGGTGLGLAISRRLARLMGGDLVVEHRADEGPSGDSPDDSHENSHGATFTLWLPAPASAVPAAVREPAPLRGVAGGGADTPALDAAGYAALNALGTRLAGAAESVAERFVSAVRADARFPGVGDLSTAQLRDHTAPVVSLLANHLMTVGESGARVPELLADGAQIQRVMAELHGAQRFRLGWREGDVERELPLLRAAVQRAIGGEDGGARAGAPPDRAAAAAAQYATTVVRQVLDQMLQTSLRAFRFARAAATP